MKAWFKQVECPANAMEGGVQERSFGEPAEGTEQLECDGANLVIIGRGCSAKAEDTVFQKEAGRRRGLQRAHSDGDEGVLRGWIENRIVKEHGVADMDVGDNTTVRGAKRGRGRSETVMGICGMNFKRLEDCPPSAIGSRLVRPG